MVNKFIFSALLLLTTTASVLGTITTQNQAQATGGVQEILPIIMPMIDDAKQFIQNGETDKALDKLEELQNELRNTFEIEDEDE